MVEFFLMQSANTMSNINNIYSTWSWNLRVTYPKVWANKTQILCVPRYHIMSENRFLHTVCNRSATENICFQQNKCPSSLFDLWKSPSKSSYETMAGRVCNEPDVFLMGCMQQVIQGWCIVIQRGRSLGSFWIGIICRWLPSDHPHKHFQLEGGPLSFEVWDNSYHHH